MSFYYIFKEKRNENRLPKNSWRLKENELITDDDRCAVCLLRPESDLLTSAVVRSTVDYIMAANNEEIKLFDIDKKTGE